MKKSNENRVLLYYNKDGATNFEASVEAVQQGANDLVQIFESFQNYKKIKSLEDFETLVADPLLMFDDTLQLNVNFRESGGKKGNPAVIASLFEIDRPSYISIIKGEKIIEGTCKPCSKLKVKQIGSGVISRSNYLQYKSFLQWGKNRFELNEEAIQEKIDSFKQYIENPKELEVYNFWHGLNDSLNEAGRRYLGNDALEKISKLLNNRIIYSYGDNKLHIDEMKLTQEINSLKN